MNPTLAVRERSGKGVTGTDDQIELLATAQMFHRLRHQRQGGRTTSALAQPVKCARPHWSTAEIDPASSVVTQREQVRSWQELRHCCEGLFASGHTR